MLRKLLVLALVISFVLPTVALAQDEEVELTFMHFWTDNTVGAGKVVQDQLDAWLEEHPNVTVDMQTMSHDEYYTLFRVLASSDELPDVFIMNADMTTPTTNAGMLIDITDALAENPEWSEIQIPGGLVEWMADGHNYGVGAQMIITHVIYWNKDIFSEIGLEEFPASWEELTEAIMLLKEAGYTPIALGSKAGWPLFDCLFGTFSFRITGLDWYNDLLAHEAAFTDPEFVSVLEHFAELVELGAFNEDATSLDNMEARTLYYNGEAAMFMEGNWAISEGLAQQDIAEVTGLALWPAIEGGLGKPNEVTWAAGWGWAANNKLEGAAREAAISLLQAMSSEAYGRQRLEAADLPAQIITEYDGSNLPELFVELNDLSLGWEAVPILTLGFPPSVTDVLSTGLHEIMTGQATPEEVAAKVQAEYENYAE